MVTFSLQLSFIKKKHIIYELLYSINIFSYHNKKVKKKGFSTESKNLGIGHFKMSIFLFVKKV